MGGPEVERLIGAAGQAARPRPAQRAPGGAAAAAAARGAHAAARRRAGRGGAGGAAVPPLRQPRQPRSLHDLRRPAARPRADLRGRRRRRPVGAGAGPACIAASITCSAARCRRSAAPGRRISTSPPLLARVAEGAVTEVILALGATVDGATHRALADRAAAAARRCGHPASARACRSAARSTCSTTARWPPR